MRLDEEATEPNPDVVRVIAVPAAPRAALP
jgi:hypothetical protein